MNPSSLIVTCNNYWLTAMYIHKTLALVSNLKNSEFKFYDVIVVNNKNAIKSNCRDFYFWKDRVSIVFAIPPVGRI